MKIVYGKTLSQQEMQTVGEIAEKCDIMFDTARILLYRGIDTAEKAKAFLSPGKKGFLDPYLLLGMTEAVERIKKAKENNERVLIFGDYDADGICATTVMYRCLKEFGITADFYVPERDDGYGINVSTVERLNQNGDLKLMITVDCGISDAVKIETLKQKGIDVIVTDHHEPPEELPKTICINPKLSGQSYPFDGLCGAGVAYKLGNALIGDQADKFLDFVALATVADSMDLVKENRDLVYEGLKLFNDDKKLRLAFKYLLGDNNRQVTAHSLAFTVAPRINAGGRMGDAATSLKIFTSENPNEIFDLAVKLNQYNISRQTECDNIYREAIEKIRQNNLDEKSIIIVADERWSTGFVGIVAARLVEDYSRPVIVFAGYDGYYKGSARSVDGINIHDAVTSVKDLLLSFGGHAQAAGVSVSKENFDKLSNALNAYVEQAEYKIESEKIVSAEWNIERPISLRFVREIDGLEPFGVGNKRPVFTTQVETIESLPLKAGSAHYSYKTSVVEMLDFNGEKNVLPLSLPVKKKIVFELNLSVYKNRESIKGYVKNVVTERDDFSRLEPFIFQNEIARLTYIEEQGYEQISLSQVDSFIKRGTVFVVFDPNNLSHYPRLKNLPVELFDCDNTKSVSVIVSPKLIPDEFETIICLDRPLKTPSAKGKVKVVEELCGYGFIDKVCTDRAVFKEYFNKLLTLTGKSYNTSAHFAVKHFNEEDICQAIFVLETFLELGIFTIKNKALSFDEKVKNALTNSKVYSKIYMLKG